MHSIKFVVVLSSTVLIIGVLWLLIFFAMPPPFLANSSFLVEDYEYRVIDVRPDTVPIDLQYNYYIYLKDIEHLTKKQLIDFLQKYRVEGKLEPPLRDTYQPTEPDSVKIINYIFYNENILKHVRWESSREITLHKTEMGHICYKEPEEIEFDTCIVTELIVR